jgi:hypothetical protein
VGAALVPAPQDLAAAIQGAVAGPLAALGEQLRVISDRLVAVEGAAAPAAVQDAQPGRAVIDADAEAAAQLFPADLNAAGGGGEGGGGAQPATPGGRLQDVERDLQNRLGLGGVRAAVPAVGAAAAGALAATGRGLRRAVDSIPFVSRPFLRPERLRLAQSEGEEIPVDLWTDDEYDRVVPGFLSFKNPGTRAELEYDLPVISRLDDVLAHIENSGGDVAAIDLRRLYEILGECRDVLGERTDGIIRRMAVAKGLGLDGETDQTCVARMAKDQKERKSRAYTDPRFPNRYEVAGSALQKAVEDRKLRLLAGPLAYAEVTKMHGPAWAKQHAGWLSSAAKEDGGGGG